MNKARLWVSISLLLVVTLLALWFTFSRKASPLSQEELTDKAIDQARVFGLQEDPQAQKAVQMRYADWLNLNNAGLGINAEKFGLTPEMPVFVLAIRGQVARQMPLGPDPEKIQGDHFDNIVIVLNAQTGELLALSGSPSADLMPIKAD